MFVAVAVGISGVAGVIALVDYTEGGPARRAFRDAEQSRLVTRNGAQTVSSASVRGSAAVGRMGVDFMPMSSVKADSALGKYIADIESGRIVVLAVDTLGFAQLTPKQRTAILLGAHLESHGDNAGGIVDVRDEYGSHAGTYHRDGRRIVWD